MELIVIGHQDAVWGFALVGVSGFVASNAEELNQALDQALSDKRIGLILVTEDIAAMADQRISHLKAYSNIPIIVEIPAPDSTAESRLSVAEIVRQTTGVRV